MFLLHGDARYVDVLERTLYNGLLSGVSIDGKTFFYPNPLESNGQHARMPWFGCACCPGNVTRFMASLPGYLYAVAPDSVYVNLFAASTGDIRLANGRNIKLVQETRYPWEGQIKLTVVPDRTETFAIKVRIPGWARGEAVPGDLYRFTDSSSEPVTLKVNGRAVPIQIDKGYVALNREWKAGDVIELGLPMPVRRVRASDKVAADRDRVAIQRGPLVYAAEWVDNPGHKVRNLLLPDSDKLTARFEPGLLGGVTVVKGRALALAYGPSGEITKKEQEFTAIPYYAWANRGAGQMTVWIPDRESAGKPAPLPTIATTSTVTASGKKELDNGIKEPRMINDGEEPQSSADTSSSYDWAPSRGTLEWVEYAFAKPATVSEASVYWLAPRGLKAPASWRILYRDGNEWKPVATRGAFLTEIDKYNTVAFQPVTTNALRLEVRLQPDAPAGISEWKVK
jgi:uncharacterized protein